MYISNVNKAQPTQLLKSPKKLRNYENSFTYIVKKTNKLRTKEGSLEKHDDIPSVEITKKKKNIHFRISKKNPKNMTIIH